MTNKVVFNLPRDTAFAADVSTNSFYFDRIGGGKFLVGEQDDIRDAIQAFFVVLHPALPLEDMYSTVSDGTLATVKFYDTLDPPNSPAYATLACAITPNGAVPAMAEEVAIVLSFQGDPVVGVNPQRLRGRIYLGPLNSNPIEVDDGRTRVELPWRSAIANAAIGLRDSPALVDANAVWVVNSEAGGFVTEITNGWVDDAFDTQRRRGPEATSRTLWS